MESEVNHHQWTRIFCSSCGSYFDVPLSCRNRFCSICNSGRRRRIRQKLTHIVSSVESVKGYSLKFLTLTIPNTPNLYAQQKELVRSFRRLRQRRFWYDKCDGGAYVLEVAGRPGNWNLHLHAVIHSKYIPVRRLSKEWSKCSPGKIVYIKRVPLSKLISYVTKYITKSDLELDSQVKASQALSGTRLFQPFGLWQGYCGSAPTIRYECPSCGCTNFIHTRVITTEFDQMLHLHGVGSTVQPYG